APADGACVLSLVQVATGGAAKADREGLDRRRRVGAHQGHDEAGVDSAAEKRAERDVAHEMALHGVAEELEKTLCDGGLAGFPPGSEAQAPVALDHDPACVANQEMPGFELANLRVDGQ